MQYISIDKIKKLKKHSFQTEFGAFPKHEYFVKVADLLSLPTVDIVNSTTVVCQFCGCEYDSELYRCCPNCVAKMNSGRRKEDKLETN